MNKDLVLQKGDIVTYKGYAGKEKMIIDGLENIKIKDFEDDGDKVLKVKRPTKYETVYKSNEILDEEEKEYLNAVIKPFRSNVRYIRKCESGWLNEEFIIIVLKKEAISLPCFKKGTMYKRMITYKEYTIEELNL